MSSRPSSSAEEKGEIMIYQTGDGLTHIDVRMEDETVWLTQAHYVNCIRPANLISASISSIFLRMAS